MSTKILLMFVLWLPMQASLAALVDQDLKLALTIGFIGSSVPEPYASDLSVGDVLNGTITAQNVDDAVDGMQNTVLMVDHKMTISGVSYDRATSGAGSGQNAFVQDGVVEWFLFQTGNGGAGIFPDLQYDAGYSWRLLLPGWSQSSPTAEAYEIRGSYSVALAAVPIPAAVWLFGSGLLGLIGIARYKG